MSHFNLFEFDVVRIVALYGALLSGVGLGIVVFAVAMLLGEPR